MDELDSKVDGLTEEERGALRAAAVILDRLDAELPNAVLFDSGDQYYVALAEAAKKLRTLAGT